LPSEEGRKIGSGPFCFMQESKERSRYISVLDPNYAINISRAVLERSFDKSIVRSAPEACSITWCSVTISEFALEQRKTARNLKPQIYCPDFTDCRQALGW
jgi:hypothetical protein